MGDVPLRWSVTPVGWARVRVIRDGLGTDWAGWQCRPLRSQCIARPEVRLAARPADTAEVIAAPIEAKTVLRWGHRRITVG